MKLITIAILAIVLGLFPAKAADIPAGSFMRGDSNDGGGYKDEDPTNQVYVKEFAMDQNLVTLAQWKTVYQWAITNGYAFRYTGTAVTVGCPVQSINWYDAVKWCNARSQWSKLQSCYYTDTNLSAVYKQGEIKLASSNVNWTNNGYRLPTEAEWEKAARGGVPGQRFPFGNTISHTQAWYSTPGAPPPYDAGPLNVFERGPTAVGTFQPNGYGLYDMAGNVREWCWDRYATNYYSTSPTTNPQGPASGTSRVVRSGSWFDEATDLRSASRHYALPTSAGNILGFRCVAVNSLQTPLVQTAVAAAPITYGQALAADLTGLNSGVTGTFTNATGAQVAGTWAFPTPTEIPNVGIYNFPVIFTPSEPNSYNPVTNTVSVTVNPAPLTITVNPDSKTYGQTKTYGSGSTAYTSTGLLNGDAIVSVTVNDTGNGGAAAASDGTYDLAPSAAVFSSGSSANYAITYRAGPLTVMPAPLMITANNAIKTYGQGASFAGTEFTSTGLLNGDTATSVTLTSTGAAATATVGIYSIVPSAATGTGLGNYSITYNPGSLTVGKATLSIAANNLIKTYGQGVTFAGTEFSHGSLANSDTVASVNLSSAGASATAPVGSYNIVPSAATGTGLTNYTISYNSGSLTVDKATLSITASNLSKAYGQSMAFAGTEFARVGLTNSDTLTSVALTSAGAAASATVAGSPYSIVPSGATGTGLTNYTISYNSGLLLVNPTPLTITAIDASRNYGANNPTFTLVYAGFVNGETNTVLGGSSSAWSPATPSFLPGVYTNLIIPSPVNTTNENYGLSYGYGTLTILNSSGSTGVANADGSLNLMVLTNLLGNTIVNQADLSAVLAHYWTNQPPVMSAFTAGKTNFTFSLTDFNFAVQVSHDLINWTNLGVSADFEFTDTNASPNAYYRLITQ